MAVRAREPRWLCRKLQEGELMAQETSQVLAIVELEQANDLPEHAVVGPERQDSAHRLGRNTGMARGPAQASWAVVRRDRGASRPASRADPGRAAAMASGARNGVQGVEQER